MGKRPERSSSLWSFLEYRKWFVADSADAVAVGLRTLAVSLVAYKVSRSQSVAGVLIAVESVLVLVSTPLGGTLADRHDRRKMMIASGLLGAVCSGFVVLLILSRHLNVVSFALILAVYGLVRGLLGGANDAILKSIVSVQSFAKAQSVREGREASVSLFGSAVSGLLYRLYSWVPFLASLLLYALEAVVSIFLPKKLGGVELESRLMLTSPVSFVTDLVSGLRWALTKQRFLLITLVGALTNVSFALLGTGTQLTLVAADTDPFLIGLIDTGMGVTSLIGSVVAGKLVDRISTGKLLLVTLMIVVACSLPMAFSASYPVIFGCMALMGISLPALNSGLCGFIFGKTPDDMQGRANAFFETALGALSALTPAATGFILQLDHGFVIAVGAAVVLELVAVLIVLCTSVVSIPAPKDWERIEL